MAVGCLCLLGQTSQAAATADGCARVGPTPDGFLNLRDGPGHHFAVRRRLSPGDRLDIDTARCGPYRGRTVCNESGDWTHVVSVPRLDAGLRAYTQGWVRTSYILYRQCVGV